MAKVLVLVLAISMGFLAEMCDVGGQFADVPLEVYDLKVVNYSHRPVHVRIRTADLSAGTTLAVSDTANWGGFKLGKWSVTVSQFERTDELDQLEETLSGRLMSPYGGNRAELAELEAQLRGVQEQIKAAEEEVASCSGKFYWETDDIHLRDTVTITFQGGVWKLTC